MCSVQLCVNWVVGFGDGHVSMVKGLVSPGTRGGGQEGQAEGLGEEEEAKLWPLLGLGVRQRIQIEGV